MRPHDVAAEVCGRAEEAHRERRCRAARRSRVGVPTCSILPVVEDDELVGDVHRLLLVVGDEHRRHADLVVQPAQPLPQLLTDGRIERAERLVEQQHPRLHRERAGERHALALTTAELGRVALGVAGKADDPQ